MLDEWETVRKASPSGIVNSTIADEGLASTVVEGRVEMFRRAGTIEHNLIPLGTIAVYVGPARRPRRASFSCSRARRPFGKAFSQVC
jgi:hypothetical protein